MADAVATQACTARWVGDAAFRRLSKYAEASCGKRQCARLLRKASGASESIAAWSSIMDPFYLRNFSHLIQTQEQEGISDAKAEHILAMLFEAGSDTSTSVLQHVFKIFALNPSAVKEAQRGRCSRPVCLDAWLLNKAKHSQQS